MSSEVLFSNDMELSEEEKAEFKDLVPVRGRITYSSASLDIAGLVRRLENGDIVIPQIGKSGDGLEVTPFQRGFVWTKQQMDSFVESMLLGYPTPSLFFVNQGDGKMVVLDGQQRLETLRLFCNGLFHDKIYRLALKGSQFDKKSYSELEADSRRFLDNTYLSVTVIRLESSPHAVEAVYDVFARLNSGGTKLTPHEIRMALYNGSLMQVIDELNRNEAWRRLYGGHLNRRFRDHELVLRIIALYKCENEYKKPLGGFLNSFASKYRYNTSDDLRVESQLFIKVAELYAELNNPTLFSTSERKQLNTSKADSLMVGAMKYLAAGGEIDVDKAAKVVTALECREDYISSISQATSDESNVHSRIASVLSEYKNA